MGGAAADHDLRRRDRHRAGFDFADVVSAVRHAAEERDVGVPGAFYMARDDVRLSGNRREGARPAESATANPNLAVGCIMTGNQEGEKK